jgi:hypothetical protein
MQGTELAAGAPQRGQKAKPGDSSKPQPLHAIEMNRQTWSKGRTIALGCVPALWSKHAREALAATA